MGVALSLRTKFVEHIVCYYNDFWKVCQLFPDPPLGEVVSLIHSANVTSSNPLHREYSRARLLVSIITCHLLDFQWQDYDHRLLADIQLPDFLLQSAISKS